MESLNNIKEIELCLENCTSVTIPYNDIQFMHIDNITKSLTVRHTSCKQKYNCYVTYNCECFEIVILPSANVNGKYNGYGEDETVFSRLTQYDDITSIMITCEDGTKENIYPKWSGQDINCNQTTTIEEDKLHIVIK